ncbi:MAG: type II toxin-antitoxin system prevent-host-death family antitoxin [Desulfobacterales bacterium]|nr:type II toxin-antitoxin system prevent-host-death family antitoxin [Desulfobacterales bacterium]
MTTVGIREAKINLSKYLKMVRQGHEVTLTDRGQPVGKIVPITAAELSLEERIRYLEERGVLAPALPGEKSVLSSPVPVLHDAAQRYLREDRDNA